MWEKASLNTWVIANVSTQMKASLFFIFYYKKASEISTTLLFPFLCSIWYKLNESMCNDPSLPQILVSYSNMVADGVNLCKNLALGANWNLCCFQGLVCLQSMSSIWNHNYFHLLGGKLELHLASQTIPCLEVVISLHSELEISVC